MPELPDVVLYLEHVERRFAGQRLDRLELVSPFVLRSVSPPVESLAGRRLQGTRRIGKRLVLEFEGAHFAVMHLMVAGRLQVKPPGSKLPRNRTLLGFHFEEGILQLTEAGKKRRASLHLVDGEEALAGHDPGGLEVFEATLEEFDGALRRGNHTLKRALTDPRILSGIGNAFSDEILLRARLSPVKLTSRLDPEEVERLLEATRSQLRAWTERLRTQSGAAFPTKVTAFRPEMAAHGKYGEPCPQCGTPIQRIVYASRETNYCPSCQTDGKLLADRALSRLLKKDWPRSLEALEEYKASRRQ